MASGLTLLPSISRPCADQEVKDNYQPISCINHERLEFAALKKQWIEIEILTGEMAGIHLLQPLDVYARGGIEWLKAQTGSGEMLELRLDRIRF